MSKIIHLKKAISAFESNNLPLAIKLLTSGEHEKPNSLEVLLLFGEIY
jgi:hypothetical protein